jgi:hypothetical protein
MKEAMVESHGTARCETLARIIEELTRRGFTENFRVAAGRLQASGTGKRFRAEDLVIRDYRRVEGISDPDDMAIVYALESKDGVRGVLADAFGVYSDPETSAVLRDIPIQRTA